DERSSLNPTDTREPRCVAEGSSFGRFGWLEMAAESMRAVDPRNWAVCKVPRQDAKRGPQRRILLRVSAIILRVLARILPPRCLGHFRGDCVAQSGCHWWLAHCFHTRWACAMRSPIRGRTRNSLDSLPLRFGH